MPYRIGYAPDDSSLCKMCKGQQAKKIKKNEVRFGVYYNRDGNEVTDWSHLRCVHVTQATRVNSVFPFGKGIDGYLALSQDDKHRVKEHFDSFRKKEPTPMESAPSPPSVVDDQSTTFGDVEPSWGADPNPSTPSTPPAPKSTVSGSERFGAESRASSTVASRVPFPRERVRPFSSLPSAKEQPTPTGSLEEELDNLEICNLKVQVAECDVTAAESRLRLERKRVKALEHTLEFQKRRHIQVDEELVEMQIVEADLKVTEAECVLEEVRAAFERSKLQLLQKDLLVRRLKKNAATPSFKV